MQQATTNPIPRKLPSLTRRVSNNTAAALVAACVALLGFAAQANAASVATVPMPSDSSIPADQCLNDSRCMLFATVQFKDVMNETNSVTVTTGDPGKNQIVINDAAHEIATGSGCYNTDPNTARCEWNETDFQLGGGDDLLKLVPAIASRGPVFESVNLGPGNDSATTASGSNIEGGPGNDQIVGSPSHDEILGGPGLDTVVAGAGDDVVLDGESDAEATSDSYDGGAGSDRVSYRIRAQQSLSVNLGAGTESNGISESDHVQSFESTETGGGNDTVVGEASQERHKYIWTHDGNDTINARGLTGVSITAGHGDDRVVGSNGPDIIHGQKGNDSISAGRGEDFVSSGPGTDTVRLKDGRLDTLDCFHTGSDRILADRFDKRLASCRR